MKYYIAKFVTLAVEKKFTVQQHLKREKHKRGRRRFQDGGREGERKQTLLGQNSESSKCSVFYEELCKAFICADIPVSKANNPRLSGFLENHAGKSLLDSSTPRKTYVSRCYENNMKKICKNMVGDVEGIVRGVHVGDFTRGWRRHGDQGGAPALSHGTGSFRGSPDKQVLGRRVQFGRDAFIQLDDGGVRDLDTQDCQDVLELCQFILVHLHRNREMCKSLRKTTPSSHDQDRTPISHLRQCSLMQEWTMSTPKQVNCSVSAPSHVQNVTYLHDPIVQELKDQSEEVLADVWERDHRGLRPTVLHQQRRESTTVLMDGNASADKLPPLIVFNGKNVRDMWTAPANSSFPNMSYAASINGWMDGKFQAPRRLPVLETESGCRLFSTNAASRLVLPPHPGREVQVDQWLEWEAAQLQPLVASISNLTTKLDTSVQNNIVEKLMLLDAALEGKRFIDGDGISVADIAVWCTLYSVVTEPKLRQSWLANAANILSWFTCLQGLEHFQSLSLLPDSTGVAYQRTDGSVTRCQQSAVSAIKMKAGVAAYKQFLAATWLPSNTASGEKDHPKLTTLTSVTGLAKEVPVTEAELEAAREAWLHGAARRPTPKPRTHPVYVYTSLHLLGVTLSPFSHYGVLPRAGERNILVTSALPYVNNVPHLGNIIGCVLSADVFARFSRLSNDNTLFICGTDEYGTATETKALEEGLSPQEICDKYFKIHDAIYKWFNISFDYFGRTTTPEQTRICQDLFLRLHEKGFTLTESMEQLLCENCKRYLADRFVEGTCPKCGYEDARGDQCDGCGHLINATELGNPRCKVCGQRPVIRHSDQFFLNLPKVNNSSSDVPTTLPPFRPFFTHSHTCSYPLHVFTRRVPSPLFQFEVKLNLIIQDIPQAESKFIEPVLQTWVESVCNGWSNNARVITRSWLKDGLKPRCITRDLKWGIPVPLEGYTDKVFYVWFDAPIGYLSITACYTDQWRLWWQPAQQSPVSLYQFMAKDNVPFHSVMFPSCLLGAGQGHTLLEHLMATEYLNYEDGKFSKSRGVGVFGTDARDTGIPSDVWRFYLLYVRPESQDSNFSWVDLATKNNSELLNNLGNFVNRALMFAEKNFDGVVPEMSPDDSDMRLLVLVSREVKGYIDALQRARLRDGIRHILSISRHGNQYMQGTQPWVLFKGSEADRLRASTVIGICCNLSCLLAILLSPYMPASAKTMQEQLGAPDNVFLISGEVTRLLPPGHKLGKPSPLFSKIEPALIDKLKLEFSGRQKSASPNKTSVSSGTEVVTKLEEAVAQQGELVRKLKSSGVAKSEWQPHVATLLELKKQLVAAQAVNKTTNGPIASTDVKIGDVATLESEVAKQGELVRKLKSSGVPKSEWQPQVTVLLQLKQKLTTAQASKK
uniref:methionine--tRNA ligase n=1 Tax=Timema douglasi TaxID=61478 RepID=A0A7R8VNY2_TIMDO|nr:unnamed protein product [Timema douglasi]